MDALSAVTINAARISGADRVGSLKASEDADLLILSGRRCGLMTKAERVYIDGGLTCVAAHVAA